MSGLEVAAAVFGIIGGIATATKMASDLRELYVKKKKGKGGAAKSISETIEQRLGRLERQLSASETALQEYRRLNARLSCKFIVLLSGCIEMFTNDAMLTIPSGNSDRCSEGLQCHFGEHCGEFAAY
jgi:hypothetical protein